MYAILRVDKLKTKGAISIAVKHHLRQIETQNANPNLTEKNRILVGGTNPDAIASECDKYHARRQDAVRGIGFVLTASPEFFEGKTPEQIDSWADTSINFMKRKYGDRLVFANLQLDETSPHVQGVIIPANSENKLDARTMFGREALRNLQTEYAKSVEGYGLKRGKERSPAKHTTIKEFYGALKDDKPLPKLTTSLNLPGKLDRLKDEKMKDFKEAAQREMIDQLWPPLIEARNAAAAGQIIMKERDDLEKTYAARIQAAEKERDLAKQEAAYEKKLRLEAVEKAKEMKTEVSWSELLDKLEFKQDSRDRSIYRDPRGYKYSISTDTGLWRCFDEEMGGKGKVALVQNQFNVEFGKALGWLRDNFGKDRTVTTRTNEEHKPKVIEDVEQAQSITYEPPYDHDKSWRVVRSYLVDHRKLDPKIIDSLHENQWIYGIRNIVEKNGVDVEVHNAYFIQVAPDGTPTGGTLRGAYKDSNFKGEHRGTHKGLGAFIIGENEKPTAIAVVESPIDAIALYQNRVQAKDAKGLLVVSSGGAGQEGVKKYLDAFPSAKMFLAHDNDPAGDRMANELAQSYKDRSPERIRPKNKDWASSIGDFSAIKESLTAEKPHMTMKQYKELEQKNTVREFFPSSGPSFGR